MASATTDLSTLDPTAVAALQAQFTGLVQAAYPELDLTRGVVHDVVLHLAAVLQTADQADIDALRRSFSLSLIRGTPEAADPAVVDLILANFRVGRLPGQAAIGPVQVVLDSAVPVVIPAGAPFTVGSSTFVTSTSYAVRTDPTQVTSATDLVLSALGNGQYAFSIPVTCTVVGTVGMLRRGQTLTPGFTVPHLLLAFAAADFTGGIDAETNAGLISRLDTGIAAPCFGNRGNIATLILAQPAFARIPALSIVGAGDPELVRAARSILPILLPGRADVYARTAALPTSLAVTVSATLVATTGAGGVWQATLGPTDAPAFYRVLQAATPDLAATLMPSDPGFAILSDIRTAATPSSGWYPDLRPGPPGGTAVDAAYTAYQIATIRFVDDRTPTVGLTVGTSQGTYQLTVLALPAIDELQTFLGGRSVRPAGGDVLVRAPVPCELSAGVEVRLPAGVIGPDPTDAAAAIAAAVNALGFVGTLHSSTVAAAIAPLLPPGAAVGPVDLFGRIRRHDGTTVYLRDPRGVALSLPDDPANGVSARTTCFFLDPASVVITTRVLPTPEV